jgi:outer membrane beta-barrel protein
VEELCHPAAAVAVAAPALEGVAAVEGVEEVRLLRQRARARLKNKIKSLLKDEGGQVRATRVSLITAFRTILGLSVVVSLLSSEASAEAPVTKAASSKPDIYELTEIVAVQNRAFQFPESVSFFGSYMPSDAFNRSIGVGGSYSYTINDRYAWEVIRYSHVMTSPTAAKQDVQNQNLSLVAGNGGVLDYPTNIFNTGVTFTPLYNKGLLFNKTLVYSEISFYLGAGLSTFAQTGNRFLITPGVQARFYYSQGTAILAHFRDHFYEDPSNGFSNMIDFGLAVEFKVGLFSIFSKGKNP